MYLGVTCLRYGTAAMRLQERKRRVSSTFLEPLQPTTVSIYDALVRKHPLHTYGGLPSCSHVAGTNFGQWSRQEMQFLQGVLHFTSMHKCTIVHVFFSAQSGFKSEDRFPFTYLWFLTSRMIVDEFFSTVFAILRSELPLSRPSCILILSSSVRCDMVTTILPNGGRCCHEMHDLMITEILKIFQYF